MRGGIQQGGQDHELALASVSVLELHLDEAQGQGLRQRLPCLRADPAQLRLRRPSPGDDPLVPADLFALPPVERAMPGLMQPHQHVRTPGTGEGDQLIAAVGPVGEKQIPFFNKIEQVMGDRGVVGSLLGHHEALPAAVGEVDERAKPMTGNPHPGACPDGADRPPGSRACP